MLTFLCLGCFACFGLVALTDEQRRSATQRIREAWRLSDVSVTKAALWMALDRGDLARGLSGQQKLDFWRLQMLPKRVHQWLAVLELRDYGTPELTESIMQAAELSRKQEK